MPGINSLSYLYAQKGREFIEKLLSSHVTVNERMDGSRFSFEAGSDGELKFFRRGDLITLVDMAVSSYWDEPVRYIRAVAGEAGLPPGMRFGCRYFPNTMPVRVRYDRLPKNKLVLSDITVRDASGAVTRSIDDKKTLDEWADRLGVTRPPIIFQGFLTPKQRMQVMEYVSLPADKVAARFGSGGFTEHILRILDPAAMPCLNDTLERPIDALVFRFGRGEQVLAKVMDPLFQRLGSENEPKENRRPADIFSLTLLDIHDFLQTMWRPEKRRFAGVRLRKKTYEERYLEFVCQAFNLFIKERGHKYEGINFETPRHLRGPERRPNIDVIPDPATRAILGAGDVNQELFKIFLNSWRRKKKKPHGLFTRDMIVHYNAMVDHVADFIASGMNEELINFDEYKRIFWTANEDDDDGPPLDVAAPDGDDAAPAGDISEPPEVDPDTDTMIDAMTKARGDSPTVSADVLAASWVRAMAEPARPRKAPKKPREKGPQRVNVLIGRLLPTHAIHVAACQSMKKKNGLRCVLVGITPPAGGRVSAELAARAAESAHAANADTVAGVIWVGRWLLRDAVFMLREMGMEPAMIGVDKDDAAWARMQASYDAETGKIELEGDVATFTFHDHENEAIKAAERGDFLVFRRIVGQPAELFSYFKEELSRGKPHDTPPRQ